MLSSRSSLRHCQSRWLRSLTVIYPCDACRYQMFLQLKLDVLSGRLKCSDDDVAQLSALALQCESLGLVLFATVTLLGRIHHLHAMHKMRPTATDVARSTLRATSVAVGRVCLSLMTTCYCRYFYNRGISNKMVARASLALNFIHS